MPTIELIEKDEIWEARVMTAPDMKATGRNRSEAIGKLVENHPDLFNVYQFINRPVSNVSNSSKPENLVASNQSTKASDTDDGLAYLESYEN
jgi:hypothetical protein